MSIRFDASTDMLTRTVMLPSISRWTIMGWFYMSVDRNGFTSFFSFGSAGARNTIGTESDGTTFMLWNNNTTMTGTNLSVLTWYHVTAVGSGTGAGAAKLYLNGGLNITHSLLSLTGATIWIGNNDSSEFLNGRAAQVKIWNDTLSVDAIKAEMWATKPVRWANLNAWYPLPSPRDVRDYYARRDFTRAGTLTEEADPPWMTYRPPPNRPLRYWAQAAASAAANAPRSKTYQQAVKRAGFY